MKITPISKPLPGEHLVATWPKLRPDTADTREYSDPQWRQRLRFWSGRSLTAQALERDQRSKAGGLAWLGRALTPGIVRGLSVSLETPPPSDAGLTPQGSFAHLATGYGITHSGEDVVVHQALRIALADLPILNAADEADFPLAAILVLRPAEFRRFDNEDPDDPCEFDPSRDAFADEQRIDATQVALYALPQDLLSSLDLDDPDDPRWRNRLAHALLARDASNSSRLSLRYLASRAPQLRWGTTLQRSEPSPWEQAGLPLALISSQLVPGSGRRFFADRYSVARRGGLAHPRTRPAFRIATEESDESLAPAGSGNPTLWRARVDQFAEQLSEFSPDADPTTLSQYFQYLPPCGLLPRSALTLLNTEEAERISAPDRAAVSRFFPDHLAIETTPVTYPDLETLLADSAPLAPIDFSTAAPELIRIVTPVSEASFDPDLLVIEKENPVFLDEIGRLVAERQDQLQRRDFIKANYDRLGRFQNGPPSDSVRPKRSNEQLEPEPIETASALPFSAALRSPDRAHGLAELELSLPSSHELKDRATLFARIRVNHDAPPPVLQITWNVGDREYGHRWTEPPAYPHQSYDESGEPYPTPLWRDFAVEAAELGIQSGSISSVSIRIENGQIALSQIGQLFGEGSAEFWWTAGDDATEPIAKGGLWETVSGDALMAPFERPYEPAFADGSTLDERLDDLDTSLKRPEGEKTREVGIAKVIADLETEIKKGDDSVDIGFIKTQANIHRIRQVILGKEAANELLTSPSLSSIVDSKSARMSTDELLAAYQQLPNQPPTDEVPTDAASTSERERSAPPTSESGRMSFLSIPASSGNESVFFNVTSPSSGAADPFAESIIRSGSIGSAPIGFETGITQKFPGGFFDEGLFLKETVAPTKAHVIGAQPKVGQSVVPRDLSFSKRFDDGAAFNAFNYADAELQSTLSHIPQLKLGIEDDSETIPDVTDRDNNPVSFGQISNASDAFLSGLKLPQADTQDSSSVLSKGIKLADLNVLVLRRFEFHIARRRSILARAKEVLEALQSQLSLMANRLGVIEGRLAGARHDVSVARALRQEEQARVAGVNKRRDSIIKDEVKLLAYVRPRMVDTSSYRTQGWKANSSEALPSVPACLARHGDTPAALRSFTQLFRHSPARWFTALRPQLDTIKRRESFLELIADAQVSALEFSRKTSPAHVETSLPQASKHAIFTGFSRLQSWRAQTTKRPLSPGAGLGWEALRQEAEKHVSLGDLISGRHGSSSLSTLATQELEKIEGVATCLHAEFSAVSPAIRLSWIERYSQFDEPVSLRDLSRLPHYGSFPRETRQRFQDFADWLFGRLASKAPDAVAMMNDLLRICLLLASHAPVKAIVTGHVPRPTPLRPGAFIPILPFDPTRIHMGMQIQVWKKNEIIAHGLVSDLNDQEVSAKISRITGSTTDSVDQSMRIQFLEPELAASRESGRT